MLRKLAVHCVLLSLFCVPIVGLSGCSKEDMTPVQTSEDDIAQFLAENPEENYSSDGDAEAEAEQMEEEETEQTEDNTEVDE